MIPASSCHSHQPMCIRKQQVPQPNPEDRLGKTILNANLTQAAIAALRACMASSSLLQARDAPRTPTIGSTKGENVGMK
eukprot:348886-Pelagomonas_calceolata.AAC.3